MFEGVSLLYDKELRLFCSESIFEDSQGLQKRPRRADHDEGRLDDVQQGSLKLLPSWRVSILLRRDPGRGVPP